MSKFMKTVAMMAISAACMLPSFATEAATVALVPLVNNVVDRDDLGAIYYDRAIEAIKNGDSELVDDQRVEKVMDKVVKQGALPTEADLRTISEEGNVDIVIAMEVNELERVDIMMDNAREQEFTLKVTGKCVYYNALTNQHKLIKISDSDRQPLSVGARYDVEGEIFANNVTRYVKRILGVKKVSFEKPRISGAGLKGNRK